MKDSIAVSRYRDVLATYLAPQWRMVLLLAALLFGNIGLQLYTPQLLRTFIDTALANGPARTLTTVALLFLGVALVSQALGVGIA
jgi:ATP-binding cassette subfamily B protein/ATP-binding cassette subfamily C protein